jgi:hypothetical protein
MELGENRLGNFSFGVRRIFLGCALLPCLLTLANHCFEWGLFGRFDRWTLTASFADPRAVR